MHIHDKVLEKKYALPTVELSKVLTYVDKKLSSTEEGGLIVGRSGIGKTTMIYLLRQALEKRYPDEYLYYVVEAKYEEETKKKFYNRIIEDCGFQMIGKSKSRATGEDLQRFVWSKLIKEAGKTEKDIIMFIDCAERLTHDCYIMLCDIVNSVSTIETGISMKIFFFGTTEIEGKRNKFIALNNELVVRRFLAVPYKMKGIVDERSLKAFLAQYDTKQIGFRGITSTFTERYFPNAYNDGHRLSDDSETIYNVLRTRMKKQEIDITMKSVNELIRGMFKMYGDLSSSSKYWPDRKDWIEAFNQTSIIENMSVSDELDRAWERRKEEYDFA